MSAPTRLLLRGRPSPTRKRATPRPVRKATSSPAKAATERMRERTAAQSPRRRPDAVASADVPTATADRTAPSLREMDDDILAVEYTKALAASDEDRVAEIERELDRRDRRDEGEVSEEESAAFLDQMSSGKKRTQAEQAKEAYEDWVHNQYLRASEATNGNLLNRAGRAAGFDETSMLNGAANRTQVKKYASEELLRWFAEPGNERMTQTEFVNRWMGRETAKDRERRTSGLSEF